MIDIEHDCTTDTAVKLCTGVAQSLFLVELDEETHTSFLSSKKNLFQYEIVELAK
jgi:hypothetical protein